MDQVAPRLWLTDVVEVMTNDLKRFDRVISVCDEEMTEHVSSCQHNQFYLESAPPTTSPDTNYERFADAASTLVEALSNGEAVLIHCHSGASRSVTVASAALAHHKGQSVETALQTIKEQRPSANPSDLYFNHAERYAERNHPITS